MLLVGRPGSGKTTALERLLVRSAEAAREDSTTRIPVLIRLRDLRSTVLEQIQKELQAHGLRLATEKIAELLWAARHNWGDDRIFTHINAMMAVQDVDR